MARLKTSTKHYVGLSLEPKPTPYTLGGDMAEGEPLPAGSTFEEMDTGTFHEWDGFRWQPKANVGALLQETNALLAEQNQLLRDLLAKP